MADNGLTLERINIEVDADAEKALTNLGRLKSSLIDLSSVSSIMKLSKVSNDLLDLGASLSLVSASFDSSKVNKISKALVGLQTVNDVKISSTIGKNLGTLANSLDLFTYIDTDPIRKVTSALRPLTKLNSAKGLSSVLNQIKKLPDMSKELAGVDLNAFATSIAKVTTAIKPLATEMEKVSAGFSALPTKIQRVIANNDKLTASNKNSYNSFNLLGNNMVGLTAKTTAYVYALQRAGEILSRFVAESNSYVENYNLFVVALGDYADEAYAYAQVVQSSLGIDVSEWIRTQGVFAQMATGFGNTAETANELSNALTKVSYDIASFYNIGISDAITKVESGFAGELEPLRRLGYALDQATLQQLAYAKGIDKSIENMTQQEKSQLRAIAIIEQSSNVIGDMARTIDSPANSLRILQQQMVALSRSIGNTLIPTLTTVLPYVQATTVALTNMFNKLSLFLGYEMPEFDYSGLDTSDATASIEDTEEAVESLNKATLGIDELNILEDESDTSVFDGFDLDVSGLDYDFLGNTDEIMGDLVPKMESLLEVIVALASISAVAKGFDLLSTASTKAYAKILDWITVDWSGNFDQPLSKANNSLLGLSKGMQVFAGALGFTATFISFSNTFEDLALGTIEAEEALAQSALTIGIVGTALTLAMGPIGLVVTGLGAISGAIYGYDQATRQIQSENILKGMFSETGLEIEGFSNRVIDTLTPLNEMSTQMGYLDESIVSNVDNIQSLNSDIDNYNAMIRTGGELTAENVETIKQSYSDLVTASEKAFDDNISAILLRFNENARESALALGINVDQMIADLTGFDNLYSSTIRNLELEQRELLDKILSGEASELDTQRYEENAEKLRQLTEEATIAEQSMQGFADAFNNIDFTNSTVASSEIDKLAESAIKAYEDIDSATKVALDGIELEKDRISKLFETGIITDEAKESAMATLSGLAKSIEDGAVRDKEEISVSLASASDLLNSQFQDQYQKVLDETEATWGQKAWASIVSGITGYDVRDLLAKDIEEAVSETVGKDGIQTSLDNLDNAIDYSVLEVIGENIVKGIESGMVFDLAKIMEEQFGYSGGYSAYSNPFTSSESSYDVSSSGFSSYDYETSSNSGSSDTQAIINALENAIQNSSNRTVVIEIDGKEIGYAYDEYAKTKGYFG